ncbi:MAG: TlpA disulfide reductase family protein, partial [Bryobacteraceae bacterium]
SSYDLKVRAAPFAPLLSTRKTECGTIGSSYDLKVRAAPFALFLIWSLLAAGQALSPGLSGRRAPSFSIPDSTFKQHDLLDYRGRWLLLDFMRTDCPHCKALSKTFEEMRPRYGAKVATLSIVIPPDNMTMVARYLSETKSTTPILFDSGQVAASYFNITPTSNGGFDTPHWFAINPSGMIVHDWGQSSADNADWLKELDELMAPKK